jgi:hypothetical protein
MNQEATVRRDEWVSIPVGAAILGVTPGQLRRMIRKGLVSVRAVTGVQTKVSRAELVRMADAAVRIAAA